MEPHKEARAVDLEGYLQGNWFPVKQDQVMAGEKGQDRCKRRVT